jgi:hypothetical protein
VTSYQEMAARVDAAVESGTDYPPMCDPAERAYWAHLNTSGDAMAMARAMCRAGACSMCVYPDGPVRMCAIRDAEKPGKFGPFPLCDPCAADFDDPDAVLLRVITGVMP